MNRRERRKTSAIDITGRDRYITTEALALALVALEQLPRERQPQSNMDDMRALLAQRHAGSVSFFLAEAKCRLNPDLDKIEVYRSYGFEIYISPDVQRFIDNGGKDAT